VQNKSVKLRRWPADDGGNGSLHSSAVWFILETIHK
jgi:hypothetical protein